MMTHDEINRAIATLSGWENIEIWRESSKVLVGTNTSRPELGKFVPVYVKDLDAIFDVLARHTKPLGASFGVQSVSQEYFTSPMRLYLAYGCGLTVYDSTAALALCKLMLAIASEPKKEVTEATTE